MKERYEQQNKLAQQLAPLAPAKLLEQCKDLAIAKLVLSLDQLLDKLGYHEKGIAKVPLMPFYVDKQEQCRLTTGYYLFEFLKLHKSIYQEAAKLDILDRLSTHQKGVLEACFNNAEAEYYKRNDYANHK